VTSGEGRKNAVTASPNLIAARESGVGTQLAGAYATACPQLAKADVRALTRGEPDTTGVMEYPAGDVASLQLLVTRWLIPL
jgi:hypothetical protein